MGAGDLARPGRRGVLAFGLVTVLAACTSADDSSKVRTDSGPLERRFPALGPLSDAHWLAIEMGNSSRWTVPGPSDVFIEGFARLRAGAVAAIFGAQRDFRREAPSQVKASLVRFAPPDATWVRSRTFDDGITGGRYQGGFHLDRTSDSVYFDTMNPTVARSPSPGSMRTPATRHDRRLPTAARVHARPLARADDRIRRSHGKYGVRRGGRRSGRAQEVDAQAGDHVQDGAAVPGGGDQAGVAQDGRVPAGRGRGDVAATGRFGGAAPVRGGCECGGSGAAEERDERSTIGAGCGPDRRGADMVGDGGHGQDVRGAVVADASERMMRAGREGAFLLGRPATFVEASQGPHRAKQATNETSSTGRVGGDLGCCSTGLLHVRPAAVSWPGGSSSCCSVA